MRRFVNGEAVDLDSQGAEVQKVGDRLLVRGSDGTHSALAVRSGDDVLVSYRGRQYRVQRKVPRTVGSIGASSGELRAPMPGQVVDVRVAVGDLVQKGVTLLVLEAMKTQQPFVAPYNGRVTQIPVQKGDQVGDGALLAFVEPEGKDAI